MVTVTPQTLMEWFAAEASAAGRVRRWLSELLGDHPRRTDLALVGSELFTNACASAEQADCAGALIRLAFICSRDTAGVAVRNAEPGGPGPQRAVPNLDAEDGRGLLLVSALAHTSGAYRDRTGHWWVWARLASQSTTPHKPTAGELTTGGAGSYAEGPPDPASGLFPGPRGHREG